MRREVEEPNRRSTDFDDVMASGPQFNWSMTGEPLLDVFLPQVLAEGMHGVRYLGGQPYIQVTSSEAKDWLRRPAVAALNQTLLSKLGLTNEEPAA
jgi:hypothetical protein